MQRMPLGNVTQVRLSLSKLIRDYRFGDELYDTKFRNTVYAINSLLSAFKIEAELDLLPEVMRQLDEFEGLTRVLE